MKKIRFSNYITLIISMFMSLLIFIALTPVNALADDEYRALIDTGFESGEFEDWSSFGNKSEIIITKDKVYSGFSALKVQKREEAWSGPALNITDIIASGEEYLFRAYAISDSAEEISVMMTLKFVDEAGTESYVNMSTTVVGKDKWVLMESSAVIPENVNDAIFYFETANGTDDFCIDDVSVYGYGKKKEEIVYEENETALEFDFEGSTGGWIPRGEVQMEVTDSFSYSGNYSLYVSRKNEHWNAPMVRIASVQPRVNYTYSAYVMYMEKNCPKNHSFSLRLQYNLNGEEIYSTIKSKELQNGTWSKISGDFMLPANATNVYFYVRADDDNQQQDFENLSFYVDNVKIVDSTAALRIRKRNITILVFIGLIVLAGIFLLARYFIKKNNETKAAIRSACIDSMTNAYNRNTYEEDIAELEKNTEKCKRIFVTACDVNFLKYINDNYGHDSGDKAIIRCAAVLLRVVGKKGKVYRIGGDEFMCITDNDMTDAINVEFARESADYKGYPFSAAVGTAYFDPFTDLSGPDIKALVARSDKAMYEHKVEIKKNVDFID